MVHTEAACPVTRSRLMGALERPGSKDLLASAEYREPDSGTTFKVFPRPGGGIEIMVGASYHGFDTYGNYLHRHPQANLVEARKIVAALVPENFLAGTEISFASNQQSA